MSFCRKNLVVRFFLVAKYIKTAVKISCGTSGRYFDFSD